MPEKDNYTCNVFKHLYFAPYTINNQYKLFNAVRGNKETIQRLKLLQKLPAHTGCVNTVSWNETGEFILSGSDDQKLCITNGYTYKILTSIHTNHRANIFSAKFLPNASDKKVISCAGDGIIIFTHLDHIDDGFSSSFNCHFGTAYKIVTVPNDPHTFLSCGEDGTVRWYDLRIKQSCSRVDCREDILINCRRAVTALAVNPISPYQLAVGCSDSHVQLFDRRMIGTKATGSAPENTSASVTRFTVAGFENRSHRITSLVYSSNAEEMLVSYSSEYLYLFRLKNFEPRDDKCNAEFSHFQKKIPTTPSLMKRLRLRGDWSDTGPNARPEREMQESLHRPSIHTTLMQRMSDVLMRMLNEPGRTARSSNQASTSNPPPSQEEGLHNVTTEDLSSSASVAFTDSEESVGLSESSQTTIHSGTEPHILVTTAEDTSVNQAEGTSVIDNNFPSHVEPVSTLSEDVPNITVEHVHSVSNICDKEQNQTLTPIDSNKNDSVEDLSNGNRIPMSDVTSSNAECVTPLSSVEETVMMEPGDASTSSSTKDILPEGFVNDRNESESNKNVFSGSSQDLGSDDVTITRSNLQLNTRQAEPIPSSQPEQISEEMESNESTNEQFTTTPLVITMSDVGCMNLPVVEISSDSEHEPQDTNVSGLEPSILSDTCNESERVNHPVKENKMSIDKCDEECSDLSLDKTEDYSSTSLETSHQESSESSLQMSEIANRNKPIQIPEPSSNSSSSEEELTRCWFRRHSSNVDSRSDLSGELVRNMDEALASPSEETISANGGKHYYYYLPPPKLLHKFTGHRNARTMIKEANFWGEHFVMSGSDCGHIFFWDRHTAEVVMILEADRHVVNCIQPHPFDPVLASSGIDYDIKLWAPLQEEPSFDRQMASEIMLRNEVMLEETRDTITVPASFMIRMLASLNHLRTGARQRSSPSQSSQEN